MFAVVVLAILEHLGCTCLTSYVHDIALCFAHSPWIDGGGTQVIIPNDIVQTGLDVAQCIAVAQSMFDYFALELLDDLIVLADLADQHRRDHLAVVSDAVVEHEELQGTQLYGVAVCHFGDSYGVIGYLHAYVLCARNNVIHAVAQSQSLQFLNKLLGTAVVTLGHNLC